VGRAGYITPNNPISCPTSSIAGGLTILGVVLLLFAAILVYAAFGGISEVSGIFDSPDTRRVSNTTTNFKFLIVGVVIFMVGAMLIVLSLVVLPPMLAISGC
jgi:uncharacterized BrkB/YihY/UPF0761 family membrane protein